MSGGWGGGEGAARMSENFFYKNPNSEFFFYKESKSNIRIPQNAVSRLPALFHKIEVNL